MAEPQSKTRFKEEFIARVRWARMARNLSQQEMAELLGMEQGKYQKYESRSLLPHDLVVRFCLICGVDTDWLFAKKGRGPVTPEPTRKPRSKRATRTLGRKRPERPYL